MAGRAKVGCGANSVKRSCASTAPGSRWFQKESHCGAVRRFSRSTRGPMCSCRAISRGLFCWTGWRRRVSEPNASSALSAHFAFGLLEAGPRARALIAISPLYGALEVKHLFHAFSTSFLHPFIPVSLFDLESRFFAPTHTCWRPARTGAVKVGRRSGLAARSVVSRPRLDGPEHGGTLVVVGMTRPRGARCRGTRNSRRNLVSGGSQ